VANAGDTFALLVSNSKEKSIWIGLPMSETHSCSNKTELKRAKDSGAEIQWVNGESLEVLREGDKVDEKRGDKGFIVGTSSEGRYRIQVLITIHSLLNY
jgi:Protein phosphatase 2C